MIAEFTIQDYYFMKDNFTEDYDGGMYMSQPAFKDKALEKIERAYKPGLFNPIFLTLVCIAPYLWLFVDIADERYDRLNLLALLSGIGVSMITLSWTFFLINIKKYNKETKAYLSDPENYEW